MQDTARFDRVTIAFHWTTAVLIVIQFASGYAMGIEGGAALGHLLVVHRSVGACIFGLVLLRLLWRRRFAYLPPFPAHMPKVQQWAAKANEYGLYVLLLMQPLTGAGDTLFRAKPFLLFAWTIPALVSRQPGIYQPLHEIHELGAEALIALAGLHAAAALSHHFVLRDRVLHRMLPGRASETDLQVPSR